MGAAYSLAVLLSANNEYTVENRYSHFCDRDTQGTDIMSSPLGRLTAVGNSSPSPVYPRQVSRGRNASEAVAELDAKLYSCPKCQTIDRTQMDAI